MESVLEAQATSSRSARVFLAAGFIFIWNIAQGSSYTYVGMTLPSHKNGTDGFILLNEDELSWYISVGPFMMLLGTLLGNPLGECIGRKKTLILSSLLSISSLVVMFFSSSTNYLHSFPTLITARIVNTAASGLSIMAPFVLISEISTISHRPVLANMNNFAISIGIMLNFIYLIFFPVNLLLPVLLGIMILFLISIPLIPESPHWLIRKGRTDEAEAVYRTIRGPEYTGIQQEIKEVVFVSSQESAAKGENKWRSRLFLQPLGILVVLFLTIGLCGVDSPINLYGPSMFSEFGFKGEWDNLEVMIPSGQCLGYGISSFLMKWMSKKKQYILSTITMSVASGLMVAAYLLKPDFGAAGTAEEVLLCLGALGITLGYGTGLGAVAYAMPGELLSPDNKTLCISIAHSVRMVTTAATVKAYPFLVDALGYPVLFGFHSLVTLSSAAFVFRFLPETKDKSLTEIQQLFIK